MRVAPDRPDHSENVGVALSQNPVTAVTAATVTLYSADGLIAVQEEHDGVVADVPQVVSNSVGDDDLTSLTWLQDKNLLKSVHELPKHECINDNASDSTLSNSSASSSSSHKTLNQCVNVMPRVSYDPQIHVNSKPPFSFSCLIFMAIEDSVDKALPVKDIYVWILNHFPYYRNAPTGWKNSVRHNLSLNKCFKKVDKSPNLGKGSLWMVEQRFRPCLIQALQKTPHHQYHKFIRNLNNSNNSNKKPSSENINICSDNNNIKSCIKEEMVTEDMNLLTTNICAISQQNQPTGIFIKENLADDVDAAATAMLVLKHGACAFDITPKNVGFSVSDNKSAPSIQKTTIEEKLDTSNGANNDHNYGCHHNLTLDSEGKETVNSYWITIKDDVEEQRKIEEGAADALLNLAGITTYYNTRKRSWPSDEQRNVKHTVDQESSYKPRLLRKEKIIEINSKESINPSETNQILIDNDVHNNIVNKTCSNVNRSDLNDGKKSSKTRVTVTSNRQLRNKKNKKEKTS